MHKYSQQCGPNATDYFDDYIKDFYSNNILYNYDMTEILFCIRKRKGMPKKASPIAS